MPRTLRLWPLGHACNGVCECVGGSLRHYMVQDAMAVFAHGRARRLHHDAFGKRRMGSSDKTNARFRCRKATPAGFPLPPGTPSKETQFPLCESGDWAMWIVMYVAMIASLSAMGMLPVAEYRNQLPHDHA